MTSNRTIKMPKLTILVVYFSALGLTACGGSTGSTSASATAASPATVTVTTSARPPAPTTTAPATTTLAGAPVCRAAGLTLSYLGGQGAAGHGVLGFALKNTGTTSCSTSGFPGIQFLDNAGKPLPTAPVRITRDFFGTAPKVLLTLAPGETASFRLGVIHVPTAHHTCTTASSLQVIPPNDTSALKVPVPGGAYECGTATVSPMRPAGSAYKSG